MPTALVPRTMYRWLLGVLLCVLLAWAGFRLLPPAHAGSPPAFAVEYTELSSGYSSGMAVQRHMYYARRADGADVKELRGALFNTRIVRVPALKLIVQVSDSERVKTTYDYSATDATVVRDADRPDCAPTRSHERLGSRDVLGHEVYGYRFSEDTQGVRLESDHWFAPALGCYQLSLNSRRKDSKGQVTAEFEKRPTHVALGEPDGRAFLVPDEYGEVVPSVFEETVLRSKVREERGRDAADLQVIPDGVRSRWAEKNQRYQDLKKR